MLYLVQFDFKIPRFNKNKIVALIELLYFCAVKHCRSIIILFFAVSLFVGSVGIHVFEHFCKVDGTEYSFFVPSAHSCEPAKKIKSCCHEKVEKKSHSFKENCCEEDLISFKITSNFIQKDFQNNQQLAVTSAHQLFIFEVNFMLRNKLVCDFPINRPPPKKGQEILILNQVFRI